MAFQYSLRRLFVWVTIASLSLGLVGWRIHVAREYELALATAGEQIRKCGGSFSVGQAHENYYINLIGSKVTDEQFRSMAQCFRKFSPRNIDGRGYFSIQLANTAITDQSVAELAGLNIMVLSLSNTKVTDASIPQLCKFSGMLSSLSIAGTQISPQGAKQLNAQLKTCQVDY